jgi:ribosomal protein S26
VSERIHCDHCDAVIPKDVTRLTLRCGTAKDDTFHTEQDERDYCADCVEKIPILNAIFAEQFEEGIEKSLARV